MKTRLGSCEPWGKQGDAVPSFVKCFIVLHGMDLHLGRPVMRQLCMWLDLCILAIYWLPREVVDGEDDARYALQLSEPSLQQRTLPFSRSLRLMVQDEKPRVLSQ
jgi:hypothetical protein